MFEVRISGGSIEGLKANILSLLSGLQSGPDPQMELPLPVNGSVSIAAQTTEVYGTSPQLEALKETKPAPKKRGRKPKSETQAKAPAVEESDAEDMEVPALAEELTIADVKNVVSELIALGEDGVAKAYTILKSLGAEKVSELKSENYRQFVDKVKAALSASS